MFHFNRGVAIHGAWAFVHCKVSRRSAEVSEMFHLNLLNFWRTTMCKKQIQIWAALLAVGLVLCATSAFAQLLDSVTTSATAAYSLRQLSSSYAGPAVQVRRSGDNALMDIGFVGGQLDVASLEAFVAGGNGDGFVRRWYDQSGNGRDVYKPAGFESQEPQIAAGGSILTASNGQPAIRWDGTNDNLRAQAGDGGANLIDHNDIFTVAQFSSQPANNPDNMRLFNFADGGSTRLSAGAEGVSGGGDGEHAFYYNSGAFNIEDSDVLITLDELFLSTLVADGTSGAGNEFIRYELDGTPIIDLMAATLNESHNQLIVGSGNDSGSAAVLDGFIQEFLVFSGSNNLSQSEFDVVSQNLLSTFQTQVPEPSSMALWSLLVIGMIGYGWRRRFRR
jgi:hypothetical protein